MSFGRLIDAVSDNNWEEKPVSLKEFVYSEKFLHHPPLSDIQMDIAERMSQILKPETLIELWGKEEGDRLWKKTRKDLVLVLSKGSGKNTITQIAFTYIVYQLLCMKSPQRYYGKPEDDNIDLVNMATSARQAVNGFFNKIAAMFNRCQWFAGKFKERTNDLRFDKRVTIHSLHSSPEGAEALNILAVCLDEIDSPEIDGHSMYEALSATVDSRYPEYGKVAMLSFARSKDGFIMSFFDDCHTDNGLETTYHEHTYKLDEDLEDGLAYNEITIRWQEDVITGYKYSNIYAAKYPSHKVNPTLSIESHKMAVYRNPTDALMRFFANPPDSADNAFFKNHDKLKRIFSKENGWDGTAIQVKSQEDKNYYIHIDLSKVHDRTVVALGHVDKWVEMTLGVETGDPQPFIVIDLFRVWQPTTTNPVDHMEVMKFVLDLCSRFRVEWVTFDQWGSKEMIDKLNEKGTAAEKKSLARPEYQEFAMVVGDERIEGPEDERLMDELTHLVILPDGKVDHPNKNYNDISEAICGVIRNCVEKEVQNNSIEIITLSSLARKERLREQQTSAKIEERPNMPIDIAQWLESFKTL